MRRNKDVGIVTVEHDGIIFDVFFTVWGHKREWGIEDVRVDGIDEPSEELQIAADKAAQEWVEGAIDYERSGW